MKHPHLVGLLMLLASFVLHSPAQCAQRAGLVIALEEGVWAIADGSRRDLRVQSEVFVADTISTNERGKAQILFDDDAVLAIGPSSTVNLEQFAFDAQKKPAMSIRLMQGLTRIVSGKVVEQNPEGFKISSPLAVIGIRGTTTQHDVQPNLESHFAVHLGPNHTVQIQGPDGQTLELTSSLTGTDLQPGGATPPQPRSMTPAEQQRGMQDTLPAQPVATNTEPPMSSTPPAAQPPRTLPQQSAGIADDPLNVGSSPGLLERSITSTQESMLPQSNPTSAPEPTPPAPEPTPPAPEPTPPAPEPTPPAPEPTPPAPEPTPPAPEPTPPVVPEQPPVVNPDPPYVPDPPVVTPPVSPPVSPPSGPSHYDPYYGQG